MSCSKCSKKIQHTQKYIISKKIAIKKFKQVTEKSKNPHRLQKEVKSFLIIFKTILHRYAFNKNVNMITKKDKIIKNM